MAEKVRLGSCAVFLLDKADGCYKVRSSVGVDQKFVFPEKHSFIKRLKEKSFILTDEAPVELTSLKAHLVFPLRLHRELIGFLSLGKKKSDEVYTREDITLFSTLASQMAIALENAQLFEKLHQSYDEKLASIGQLAAGMAHEIKNPMNYSLGALNVIKREKERFKKGEINADDFDKELDDLIPILNTGLTTTTNIVNDLVDFSQVGVAGFKMDDIHRGIELTLSMIHHDLGERIAIHKDFCDDARIVCILGQMNQVFVNVFLNAMESIDKEGNIWIKTERFDDKLSIHIKDDGRGIRKGDIDKVFDPFFTTKDVGEGMGLGLSISYRIVRNHGGEIRIESEQGRGTEIIVTLPVNQKES
jgi:signal transduction histidine kinase